MQQVASSIPTANFHFVDAGSELNFLPEKLLDPILEMQSYFKWYILMYYNILLYFDITEYILQWESWIIHQKRTC